MSSSIILLSDLSYELGIIGLAELQERMEIARWLFPKGEFEPDPREPDVQQRQRPGEDKATDDFTPSLSDTQLQGETGESENPEFIEFLALSHWHFTLGDVDCVPSVPHGHENAKTQAWPRLNPYTGRVFVKMHVEDVSHRLERSEMQKIWRDDKFIELCRKQVLWYSDKSPRYLFPNARRGKHHFPRW